jgi:hypothetical protein
VFMRLMETPGGSVGLIRNETCFCAPLAHVRRGAVSRCGGADAAVLSRVGEPRC